MAYDATIIEGISPPILFTVNIARGSIIHHDAPLAHAPAPAPGIALTSFSITQSGKGLPGSHLPGIKHKTLQKT